MTEKRIGTIALLALGPLLSVLALNALVSAEAGDQGAMRAALVVLWCPFLFFSVPALVLQESRDQALSKWTSPAQSVMRAVILVPHQMLNGQRRTETIVSVAAWVVLAVAFFEPTLAAVQRMTDTLL